MMLTLSFPIAVAALLLAFDGGWLGVFLSADARPTVAEVVPDSPAARAGIAVGDVFVAVDARPLHDAEGLASAIAAREPGDVVELRVLREGTEVVLRATLSARPGAAALDPPPSADGGRGAEPAPAAEVGAPAPHLGIEVDVDTFAIRDVRAGGPAANAGVRSGDVLVRIAGREIAAEADLDDAIAGLRVGVAAAVAVRRDGVLLELAVVPAARPQRSEGVPPGFAVDHSTADSAASASGRPVLVVFGAAWCPHSRALARSFEDPAVRALTERAVCVWVDADREPALADRYGVRELPFVVVRRDGVRIGEIRGRQPEQVLGAMLERFLRAPARVREPDTGEVERRRETASRADVESLQAAIARLAGEVATLRSMGSELTRLSAIEDDLDQLKSAVERLARRGRID